MSGWPSGVTTIISPSSKRHLCLGEKNQEPCRDGFAATRAISRRGFAGRKGDGVALGMGDRDNTGFRARIGKAPQEAGAWPGEAFEIGKGLQG